MAKQLIQNASWLLTEDCNFKCDYCFVHKRPNVSKVEVGERLMWFLLNQKNATSKSTFSIGFFGGEPTLEWDVIEELVNIRNLHDKRNQVRFGMTTNASLLPPERRNFMKKNGMHALVSVDGPPQVQNIHRKTPDGKDTWPLIEDNIRGLIEEKLTNTARVTITRDTLKYMAYSVEYMLEMGFNNVAPTPVSDGYDPFQPKDYIEYDRQLDMLDHLVKKRIMAGKPPGMNYYQKCFRQLISGSQMTSPCGAGRGYIGVNWKGDIFPCHRFTQWPEWKLGNLEEGINQEEKRQMFLDYSTHKHSPKCISCNVLFCGGGCLASNYTNFGTMHKIDEASCTLSGIQFKHAKKLYEDMKDEPKFQEAYPGLFKKKKAKKGGNQEKKLTKRISNLEKELSELKKLTLKTSNAVLEIADRKGGV